MELTERPLHAQPYACALTGRDDGPIVDFGIELDGVDPHLYLRTSVIEEAGKLIGMVPKSEVEELSKRLDDLAEELVEAHRRIGAYEQVEEGMKVLEGATNE